MKIISLLLAALTLALDANSQTFTGKVVDKSNTPLENAYITVFDSIYHNTYITDSRGDFEVSDCPDSVNIIVSHISFERWTEAISVSRLKDHYLKVTLNSSDILLDAVTVKGNQPVMRKEIGKFAMDKVYLSPYAKGTNTLTFLKFVAILNTTSGAPKILSKSEPAQIFIDGRPATMPLNAIPSRNIDRIEVIATPGAEYGNQSKGGIINVILRRGVNDGLKIVTTIGSSQSYYNNQNASMFLSYSTKKLNITSSISGTNGKSYNKSISQYNFLDTNQAYNINNIYKGENYSVNASFNMEYRPSENQTWGLSISSVGSNKKINRSANTIYYKIDNHIQDSSSRANIEERSPFKPELSTNLRYELNLDDGNNSKIETNLYYGYTTNVYDIKLVDDITIGDLEPVINKNFNQNTSNSINYLGLTSKLVKNFNEDNILKTGANLYYFDMLSNLSYLQLITDSKPSQLSENNSLIYKDFTGTAYASYDRYWSDIFETSIGVRAEYHFSDGLEQNTNTYVDRSDFDVNPYFSILYLPHDDHELSLDLASSVSHPALAKLVPFRYYSSSNEYVKENQNLSSSPDVELMFSYNFFADYTLAVDYLHMKNSWTDFSIPDQDGNIITTTANYGNSQSVDLSFIVQKNFFNRRWNLNATASTSYSQDKGGYMDVIIDNSDWSYSFRLNNNIFLSKDFSWLATLSYNASSQKKFTTVDIPAMQSLVFTLQKNFSNSSISLSAGSRLNNLVEISSNLQNSNYNYSKTLRYYPTVSLSYTYTFGNEKVRRVYTKSDNNILNRTN